MERILNNSIARVVVMVVLAAGVLNGCIQSNEPLLDEGKAVNVLEPGRWIIRPVDRQSGDPGSKADAFAVVRDGTGYRIHSENGKQNNRLWIHPVDDGYFIASAAFESTLMGGQLKQPGPQWRWYGLVRKRGDGQWELIVAADCVKRRPGPSFPRFGLTLQYMNCSATSRDGLVAYFRTLKDKKPFARIRRQDSSRPAGRCLRRAARRCRHSRQ